MFAVEREVSPDGRTATYRVTGQIFFASVDRFTRAFQTEGQTDNVLIDVSAAHFWDLSGVGALAKIVAKLRREGRSVEVVGYNRASADIIAKFALPDTQGVEQKAGERRRGEGGTKV